MSRPCVIINIVIVVTKETITIIVVLVLIRISTIVFVVVIDVTILVVVVILPCILNRVFNLFERRKRDIWIMHTVSVSVRNHNRIF
jgi:hypothetical protein